MKKINVYQKNNKVCLETEVTRIEYSLKRGCWDIEYKKKTGIGLKNAYAGVEIDGHWVYIFHSYQRYTKVADIEDDVGKGKEIRFIHHNLKGEPDIIIVIRCYEEKSFFILRGEIKNRQNFSMIINRFHPLEVDEDNKAKLNMGKGLRGAKIYVDSGSCVWKGVKKLEDFRATKSSKFLRDQAVLFRGKKENKQGQHRSFGVCTIYNPKLKIALTPSLLTFEQTWTEIVTKYDVEKNRIVVWAMSCDCAEYELKPGKKIDSDKLFFDFRSSPFEALEEYAEIAYKINKPPLWPESPVGWSGWYGYGGFKDMYPLYESIVLKNIKVIREKTNLLDYGLKYIWLSVATFKDDMPGEWLKCNRERFPHGFEWLKQELEKDGLVIGLWLPHPEVADGCSFYREYPECLLKDKDGRPKLEGRMHFSKWAKVPVNK